MTSSRNGNSPRCLCPAPNTVDPRPLVGSHGQGATGATESLGSAVQLQNHGFPSYPQAGLGLGISPVPRSHCHREQEGLGLPATAVKLLVMQWQSQGKGRGTGSLHMPPCFVPLWANLEGSVLLSWVLPSSPQGREGGIHHQWGSLHWVYAPFPLPPVALGPHRAWASHEAGPRYS